VVFVAVRFVGARLTGGFSAFGAATDLSAAGFAVAAFGVVERGVVVRGAVVRGVAARVDDARAVAGLAVVGFAAALGVDLAGVVGFAGVAGAEPSVAADAFWRGCRGVAGLRGVLAVFFGVLATRAAGDRGGGVCVASGRSGSESTRQPYQPRETVRGSITNRQHRARRSGPRMWVARKVIRAQCCVQIFTYR